MAGRIPAALLALLCGLAACADARKLTQQGCTASASAGAQSTATSAVADAVSQAFATCSSCPCDAAANSSAVAVASAVAEAIANVQARRPGGPLRRLGVGTAAAYKALRRMQPWKGPAPGRRHAQVAVNGGQGCQGTASGSADAQAVATATAQAFSDAVAKGVQPAERVLGLSCLAPSITSRQGLGHSCIPCPSPPCRLQQPGAGQLAGGAAEVCLRRRQRERERERRKRQRPGRRSGVQPGRPCSSSPLAVSWPRSMPPC